MDNSFERSCQPGSSAGYSASARLMILIALVFLLQYELKTALGTSLYIMAFLQH